MPGISSTTLFNYTDTYNHLIDNLKKGIYCGYHTEILPKGITYQTAMTCFCDIPFGMVKGHFRWYGKFGIGIRKGYAMKKGVVPVWYMSNNNPLLRHAAETIFTHGNNLSASEKATIQRSKLYYGTQNDILGTPKKKKLYNEREWRYIPPDSQFNCPATDTAPITLHRFPLSKSLEEIEYIIVDTPENRNTLIHDLTGLFAARGYNANLIISKILTAEQIIRDF